MKIIIRPIVTEKTLNLAHKQNQYVFEVNAKASKVQIQKEIEAKFNVKVISVRTSNILGKQVAFGRSRISGKKSNYKKAYVNLKVGDNIKDFDIK